MRLVIFGLSVTSAWGNGHATLWRGLIRALARRGHSVVFYERDTPYYAAARDLHELPGCEIVLYGAWDDIAVRARADIAQADVAMVTSFCPDGLAADQAIREEGEALHVFYDLDSPVTLAALARGESPVYLPADGLAHVDLTLSYVGGEALTALSRNLGARFVLPLYGHVDPLSHHPTAPVAGYSADLSYLGTYAADRQDRVESHLVAAARARPAARFLIAGAQYPETMRFGGNLSKLDHVPPDEHAAFHSSCRFSLNLTRGTMAAVGYCPQGRLFEAAACGAALISDPWPGLDQFFEPGREILVAHDTADVLAALDLGDAERERLARRGRDRALTEHSSERRARDFEEALARAWRRELADTLALTGA